MSVLTDAYTTADFLTAIAADPASDAKRLVYADWLEERGECDRSEFIRVQVKLAKCSSCHGAGEVTYPEMDGETTQTCHCVRVNGKLFDRERNLFQLDTGEDTAHRIYPDFKVGNVSVFHSIGGSNLSKNAIILLRRGFPHTVTVPTMAQFCGGNVCQCVRYFGDTQLVDAECKLCVGGTVAGIGPPILAAAPTLERVGCGDKSPEQAGNRNGFSWWVENFPDQHSDLPREIFWLLEDDIPELRSDIRRAYATADAAHAARSAAMIRWAKGERL